MAFGDIIRSSSTTRTVAIPNRLGARDAMAMTLAAYLLRLEFRIAGGDDRDTVFRLRDVFPDWPSPRTDLPYPCASIIDAGDLEHVAHNLTPTPLEETWGEYDHLVAPSQGEGLRTTVLVKESGARQEFQVDFWLDKRADRQAVDALLPSAFSPEESRSGVVIRGPSLYYDRDVMFSLLATTYDDSGVSASANERRLRASIIGECDIVSLRNAQEMVQPTICKTVIDPADLPPEEIEE